MWIRFVSFRWKFVVLPGTRLLVFPSFDQSVDQETDHITAFQSSLIGVISCYFVALFVNMDHFGSLFGIREALDTTVPVTTMELKNSFGFWMVAINLSASNEPFTPVATCVMVDVSATLSCLLDKKPSQKLTQGEGYDFRGTQYWFARVCT